MPLVSGLYAVLFEQQDIAAVVQRLMTGEMSQDVDL
jgi:glycerol-3-phosphate dehydrogenase